MDATIALSEAKIDTARMRAKLLLNEYAGMKNERIESASIEADPQYMASTDAKSKAYREYQQSRCEYDIIRMAVRLIEIEMNAKRNGDEESDTEDGETDEYTETE